MWEYLEPPNKLWDGLPFLNVHNWTFCDEETILIELKGEINHEWKYPESCIFDY